MSRKSIGADIYSPIRFDGSYNDSMVSTADGSISELLYSGASNTGYKKDKKSLEPIKDEDFDERQNEEPVELFEAFPKNNDGSNSDLFSHGNNHSLFLDSKDNKSSCSSDAVFGTSPKVLFPDGSIVKSPRVKETKNTKKQNKEKLVTKRSSKSKLIPDAFSIRHVTVRRESRVLNLSPGVLITESSDRSQSSKSKEISSGISTTESLDRSQSSKSKEISSGVSTTEFSDHSQSSKSGKISSGVPIIESSDHSQSCKSKEINSGLLEASASSNVDSSSQTDLTLADLQILMNKVDLKSTSSAKSGCTVKMSTEPCLAGAVTQSAQFQGNSLEKLKDTIDNEFHDIRQILYFQQLSLSKLLYKTLDETESTNSGLKMVAESLNNIVDLLKDNRQLKNTDFSQRFHS